MTADIKEYNYSFMRNQVQWHRTGISQAHRLWFMFSLIFKKDVVASIFVQKHKGLRLFLSEGLKFSSAILGWSGSFVQLKQLGRKLLQVFPEFTALKNREL